MLRSGEGATFENHKTLLSKEEAEVYQEIPRFKSNSAHVLCALQERAVLATLGYWEDSRVPLLHIDDSDSDRILLREVVDVTQTPFVCYEADRMAKAQAYFEGGQNRADPGQYPQPALVLLDFDLGSHTGCGFLQWLRGSKKLTVPVVMFSGSAGRFHVGESYESGADYFIRKPRGIKELKTIVRTLYLSMVGEDLISSLPEYVADPRGFAMK